MSGYVETIKIEDKNSRLMVFFINSNELLEKYKAFSSKTEDLKNIELHTLYGHKVYTKTCGLNLWCQSMVQNVNLL